ncbi:MAG: TIGR03016 family PEP-CTERM system-associated outer membrane protein [Thiobacillus sp.]
MLGYASASHALDWRFEPTLTASTTYTDNANQSATDPDDALILSATPGFTLRSEGSRRVQASLHYGATGVLRFGNDESDDLYHNLNAVGKAELVEDFLFVDGTARVSQELISLLGSPADAEVNDANRATVGTYSISPSIQKRLGTFANAQARYTKSGALFENDVASDSNSNAFTASLRSGTRFDDLMWSLDYAIRETDYRDSADTTFERTSATLGYALSRKFRVFGTVGEDSNEYLSVTDTDGSFYRVGFGWAPTRRTSIEASAGESYFGPTYGVLASHRTRNTRWELRYSEDVSDISRLVTDYSNLLAVNASCPAGTILPAVPGLLDLVNAGCDLDLFFGTSLANNVFIARQLIAGVSWDLGARTTMAVRFSDLTREFQTATQGEDRVQSVSGIVNYRLSPRTSANGGLSFIRNSLDGTAAGGAAREDDIMSFHVGLNHRFTEQFNGALIYRRIERDSNAASADYEENRITASVTMRF